MNKHLPLLAVLVMVATRPVVLDDRAPWLNLLSIIPAALVAVWAWKREFSVLVAVGVLLASAFLPWYCEPVVWSCAAFVICRSVERVIPTQEALS